jgi:hypothetical protein
MPTRDDIDRLERRLPSVLEKALSRLILEKGERLPAVSDYYRQYGGFHRSDRRVVYVNGAHQSMVHIDRSWTDKPVRLCDFGHMAFGVVYEVDTDSFGAVEFDGTYSGPVRTK